MFGVYVHNNDTNFVVFLFSFPLFPFFLILLFYCFCLPLNSTIINLFCSVCVTLYVLIDDLYVSLYVSIIINNNLRHKQVDIIISKNQALQILYHV